VPIRLLADNTSRVSPRSCPTASKRNALRKSAAGASIRRRHSCVAPLPHSTFNRWFPSLQLSRQMTGNDGPIRNTRHPLKLINKGSAGRMTEVTVFGNILNIFPPSLKVCFPCFSVPIYFCGTSPNLLRGKAKTVNQQRTVRSISQRGEGSAIDRPPCSASE
jgi:hypothetical protein